MAGDLRPPGAVAIFGSDAPGEDGVIPRAQDDDHDELIIFLERDQLVSDKHRPVPRAVINRGASAALWGLRVFVLIVSAMVIYTFFSQLG